MRTICDVCEGAPALLFCAADEAALCASCDDKVHKCNKLASRHIRVRLAEPSAVRNCDICEKSPAFFFCQIDGSKLCLQCDVIVHVGGKQTHERYLLFKQRVEFTGDYLALQHTEHDYNREQNGLPHQNPVYASMKEKTVGHRVPSLAVPQYDSNPDKHDSAKIDLNAIPLPYTVIQLSLLDISRDLLRMLETALLIMRLT